MTGGRNPAIMLFRKKNSWHRLHSMSLYIHKE
nr:MAG TPA: hypothetical protein [Caudoviricetes sp.]